MFKKLIFALAVALGIYIALSILVNVCLAEDVKIKQVDKYSTVQNNKPGLVVKGDRIYQTDKYGNVQYHKPGYKIVNGKSVPVDKYGNVKRSKK